jgi:predicted nucleotidyltransferase
MFTTKYIENSLFYEAWKTKFIEKFCPNYLYFIKVSNTETDICKIVHAYEKVFRTMFNVLQKKLKTDHGLKSKLYSDILEMAEKVGYISDKKICEEIILFLSDFMLDEKNANSFKRKYIDVVSEFRNKFRYFANNSGLRDENYLIYDNTSILWGIEEEYYNEIINLFFQFENLKFVRIFGSRVTTEFKKFSDLDLILEGTYSHEEYNKISKTLYDMDIPYIFDIYDIYHDNKPFMYRNTLRSNIFYARKDYVIDDYISII